LNLRRWFLLLALLPAPGAAEVYVPLIWPTARVTGVAGAVTALSDGIETALWNPAGLGFTRGIGAAGTLCEWQPVLWTGMKYSYAAAGVGFPGLLPGRRTLGFGFDYALLDWGTMHDPEGLQQYSWERMIGLHCGALILPGFSAGISARLVSNKDVGLPISVFAGSAGLLYRHNRFLSAGLAVANLGPGIRHSSYYTASMPAQLRLGLAVKPLDTDLLRIRLLPEYSLALNRADDVWQVSALTLGAEAVLIRYLTARFGEHFSFERDGRLMQKTALSIGIGYLDYVRLEFSSEWWNTSGTESATGKFSLALNDVVGLVRELGKGI